MGTVLTILSGLVLQSFIRTRIKLDDIKLLKISNIEDEPEHDFQELMSAAVQRSKQSTRRDQQEEVRPNACSLEYRHSCFIQFVFLQD